MDIFPDRIDSKFRYVLIAANRAEQLMRGARPKIDAPTVKRTTLATDEVRNDLVGWEMGPAPRPVVEETEEIAVEESTDGAAAGAE